MLSFKEKTNLSFNAAALLLLCFVMGMAVCSGVSSEDNIGKMTYDLTPTAKKVPKEFDMTPYLDMTPVCPGGVCPTEKVVAPKATVRKNSSSCANGSCTTTKTYKTRTRRGLFGRRWTIYRK